MLPVGVLQNAFLAQLAQVTAGGVLNGRLRGLLADFAVESEVKIRPRRTIGACVDTGVAIRSTSLTVRNDVDARRGHIQASQDNRGDSAIKEGAADSTQIGAVLTARSGRRDLSETRSGGGAARERSVAISVAKKSIWFSFFIIRKKIGPQDNR